MCYCFAENVVALNTLCALYLNNVGNVVAELGKSHFKTTHTASNE